ncbi:MAG TPA: MFS transporter [Stellaceae bacterium]|nr:MFS transporter [Stellaceae bacterium]
MTVYAAAADRRDAGVDSRYAWLRLGVTLLIGTVGGAGMWSMVVALPAIQADFASDRAEASLPYTLTMLGFGLSGILVGRLVDRFGVMRPVLVAVIALGSGYVAAAAATSLWQVALAYGLLVGFGSGATFGPLMSDISHWFLRRRGMAVAICASGNYFAGTIWPPFVQHFIAVDGWRATHVGIGLFCLATMLPLTLALRRRAPVPDRGHALAEAAMPQDTLGLSPGALQALLAIAGVGCCAAMAMPQAHIVAYCGDLGYGVARGATMLSLMLGFGIVSRIGSGWIADRLGGLATLLLGSALQGVALLLYVGFDGLTSLYVISALFGLFQGGIVPSYAIIVRETFPPAEAGARLGIVLMATLIGMALGSWMPGAIFDLTGSYRAAFADGVAWNLLNGSIVLWLLLRRRRLVPA